MMSVLQPPVTSLEPPPSAAGVSRQCMCSSKGSVRVQDACGSPSWKPANPPLLCTEIFHHHTDCTNSAATSLRTRLQQLSEETVAVLQRGSLLRKVPDAVGEVCVWLRRVSRKRVRKQRLSAALLQHPSAHHIQAPPLQ